MPVGKVLNSKRTIALICGGPSLERGISLNSARSVMDHLMGTMTIVPFYVDQNKNFYQIDPALLYSNTPSDFDFKLAGMATKLSEDILIQTLKKFDLVFPTIHGNFGETGELQEFLERYQIPFVGSGSDACKNMYFKDRASQVLRHAGFETLPSHYPVSRDYEELSKEIQDFFTKHKIMRAIVKPIAGGSSIGVHSVTAVKQAVEHIMNSTVQTLIEPFCEGREFTLIILQNPKKGPVALIPTEIQISYEGGAIFDYRRKYLPTNNTVWACPPHFSDNTIEKIRTDAEIIFRLFNMRDFARLDGWVLNDGRVLFTDMNPISGMEQNSFVFQQTSRVGMTHQEALTYVVKNALNRCVRTDACESMS